MAPNFFQSALNAIPAAATSNRAFLAYLIATIAWVICALKVTRHRNFLSAIEKLPEKDRLPALIDENGNVELKEGLSPEQWIRTRIHRYFYYSFMVLCLLLVVVFGLATIRPEVTPAVIAKGVEQGLDEDRVSQSPDFLTELTDLDKANVAFDSGHPQEALDDINAAIAVIQTGVDDGVPEMRIRAYGTRARIYYKLGRFADVVNDCNEIENYGLDLEQKTALYALRGGAYRELSRPSDALGDYTACLQINPGDAYCYAESALSDIDLKDPKAALEVANEGLSKNPDDPFLLNVLVLAQSKVSMDQDEQKIAESKQKIADNEQKLAVLEEMLAVAEQNTVAVSTSNAPPNHGQ